MSKILYIEDNETIADGIKKYLQNEGILVETCSSLKEAKLKIKNQYDLILLDIVLSDGNGIEFYSFLKNKMNLPIIFLTAKDAEDDIVKGLELGADDYIVKTFRMRELTSRIKNVLNRNKKKDIVTVQNISFDLKNNVVYKNCEKIDLTALEYKILYILVENINRLVTREYLLGRIWDISSKFVNDNTLTVYIRRIRKKIEDDLDNPKIIKTIKGIGYKIEK